MQEEDNNSQNQENWAFRAEQSAYEEPTTSAQNNSTQSLTWTGSEFVANQKNAMWYGALAGFIIVVCVVVYLLTKDELSVIFIAVMGILFGVIAGRKPRQLQYIVDQEGIKVGQRSYLYSDFKSFSIQQHDAISYVSLLPLHRFHNELSIYYPPEMEDKLFSILGSILPNDQRKENYIDKLAKTIRF